jgi:GNAT superfamily N-acetyltransferase
MWCTDLAATPRADPPAGYSIRPYRRGDEDTWVDIHRLADCHNPASRELFERQFGDARGELPRRQFYLLSPEAEPVGTATAWFGQAGDGPPVGRVHWVAIVPREQGRGLSKPLLAAVCQRLLDLGYGRAYLTTSTLRVRAINLYFGHGFLPELTTPAARQAWAALLEPPAPGAATLRQDLADWLRARLSPASDA